MNPFQLSTTLRETKPQAPYQETHVKLSPNELPKIGKELGYMGSDQEIEKLEKELKEEAEIQEQSPYSEKINEYIQSIEELEVYTDADLEEGVINDKPALKDTNIDLDIKDAEGRTNFGRMEQGLPPLDENGEPYNLHHIGQSKDSLFAELKNSTHKENDAVLHDKTQPSQIDRIKFARQRAEHWKARAAEIKASLAQQ